MIDMPVGPASHAQATRTADTPKMVREHLCLAQAALATRIRSGLDVDRARRAIDQIQTLIDRVDEHRPVGSNGKHGIGRCTGTCGCEDGDNRNPWSITLYPEDRS